MGGGGTATPNLATGALVLNAAATAAGSSHRLHLHQYQASHHHADQDQQWRGWWLHLQWRQWLWRGPDDHHGDQWCGGCRSNPHPGCGIDHHDRSLKRSQPVMCWPRRPAAGMGGGGTATPNLGTGALVLNAAATAAGSAIRLHLHQYQASHHHADQDQQWRGWPLHLQWRQWLWRGPDDHHGDQWCGGCRSNPHPGCGVDHHDDH